jgi:monoterpene epsilon-lactone hydrolase
MPSFQNLIIHQFLKLNINKKKAALSAEASRDTFEKMSKWSQYPKNVKREKDLADNIPVEWYIPENLKTSGVILYLHGGGYVSGSIKTHRSFIARISKSAGTKALSIDYRLAPENPFPAGLEDGLNSYKWLLKKGIPPQQIVIAGDSAGGGLVVGLTLKIRDIGLPTPKAVVALSPWLDLLCEGESMHTNAKTDNMANKTIAHFYAKCYTSNDNRANPYASPLYASLKNFPPIFIQVSDSEILLSDTLRFEQKALSEGVNITVEINAKMPHVWQMFSPFLPEARKSIKKIGAYISQTLKN